MIFIWWLTFCLKGNSYLCNTFWSSAFPHGDIEHATRDEKCLFVMLYFARRKLE